MNQIYNSRNLKGSIDLKSVQVAILLSTIVEI